MLLRSASTPLLNSWIPHSKDLTLSPEPDSFHHQSSSRSRPVSIMAASSSPFSPASMSSVEDSVKKMTRAVSETDLGDLVVSKSKEPSFTTWNGIEIFAEEDEEEEEDDDDEDLEGDMTLSLGFIGLSEQTDVKEEALVGGGVGGGGRKIYGGGGGDRSGKYGRSGGGSWESNNNGEQSADVYYQKMLEANPGNPLLLSNYAKFLKDVQGDFVKAEEYCSRAILASPSDGNVLSMYADLIWKSHKDASRAETYFDQAVQAAPDDCYVSASYARFLWDAEEEEDEKGADFYQQNGMTSLSPKHLFRGVSRSPLAAAS